MLNHIVIMGRLTRDPELRYTQSQTPVASFTVAVDRDYSDQSGERQTDFIDCVAWRQGGEFVSKYFSKGSMIVVEGRLQSRKWQDRDGNNRTSWEVNADHTYFGEKKRDDQPREDHSSYGNYTPPPRAAQPSGNSTYVAPPARNQPQQQYQQQTFTDLGDDDGDLPF